MVIGTELNDRYRILRKLDEGGMGEVYLAEHIHLRRQEALKILHAGLAGTPQFVARFRREARAANRVHHPSIISVYDFGQLPDGRFFLAMEYAAGETLAAVLRRIGRMPVGRALGILGQLADAVSHAHSLGVVHRDLKPHNLILIDRSGKSQSELLKVVDFGVAKIIAPEYQESAGVTRQGEVFGTPHYMAPEIFRGEAADPRIDLYAIGCIAFEMVTGDTPFHGSIAELMHAQLFDAPPRPSERLPRGVVPAELDALILRCLEKEPQRRFPSGRDLLEAIKAVPGYGEPKTPSGRKSYQNIPIIPALPRAPNPGGFEEGGTDAGTDMDEEFRETGDAFAPVTGMEPALAATLVPTDEEARTAWELAVQVLAEALVDSGCSDFQLSIGVTSLNEQCSELERRLSERTDLERQGDAAAQRQREREGSLRFAIGELRFERDQALTRNEPVDRELDSQIAELERRLDQVAREAGAELTAITDRAIALAAAIADQEEARFRQCQALERLIGGLARELQRDPHIARLHASLRAAADLVAGPQARR